MVEMEIHETNEYATLMLDFHTYIRVFSEQGTPILIMHGCNPVGPEWA